MNLNYTGFLREGLEQGLGRKIKANNTIWEGEWDNGKCGNGFTRVLWNYGAIEEENYKVGFKKWANRDGCYYVIV